MILPVYLRIDIWKFELKFIHFSTFSLYIDIFLSNDIKTGLIFSDENKLDWQS